MDGPLARRQAALAGVALVGALGAIALTRAADGSGEVPPPDAAVEWREVRAAVFEVSEEPTACGVTLAADDVGIAHPVLPCGARLVVALGDRQAEGEVVERGPVEGGRAFDVTPGLASRLGLTGEAVVRWRFAD